MRAAADLNAAERPPCTADELQILDGPAQTAAGQVVGRSRPFDAAGNVDAAGRLAHDQGARFHLDAACFEEQIVAREINRGLPSDRRIVGERRGERQHVDVATPYFEIAQTGADYRGDIARPDTEPLKPRVPDRRRIVSVDVDRVYFERLEAELAQFDVARVSDRQHRRARILGWRHEQAVRTAADDREVVAAVDRDGFAVGALQH